jgi:hypothetical protein
LEFNLNLRSANDLLFPSQESDDDVAAEFKVQNCCRPSNHASSDSSFAIVESKESNEYGAGESILLTVGIFYTNERGLQ